MHNLFIVSSSYLGATGFDFIIGFAIAIVFAIIIPFINIFSSKFKKPHADTLSGEEIILNESNTSALSKATLSNHTIGLKRAEGVQKVVLDIFFFTSHKVRKVTYTVDFVNDYAAIRPDFAFDNVKIVVLNADGKLINKKVIGYPNTVFTIVASLSMAIGVACGVLVPALLHSVSLVDAEVYSIEYGITFYLIPIIIGVVMGALYFILVKLLTNSFNKGGK